MSDVTTTPAPTDRRTLLRWVGGGTSLAVVASVVALAVWPASAAETAREDGEQIGQAVSELYYADSTAEVDAALAELDTAIAESREHAGDEVADHVAAQADALERAADGFVGYHTTDDAWEAELYQAELDYAVDDLAGEAEDFREQGPEVQEAFWEGVDEGLTTS